MPTLAELSAKVDTMQTALDEEQQQVADLIASKDATIAALQAIIDAGNPNNDAEIQAILDKVDAVIADLQGTA